MSDLDLAALADAIALPDADAAQAALQRQASSARPVGSLGRLEDLATWWCSVRGSCPARPPQQPVLVVFAGDHGVARAGVSASGPEVTAHRVAALVHGETAANVLARRAGVRVRIADLAVDADYAALGLAVPPEVTRYRVRRGSGDIRVEDALTAEEALAAFRAGQAIADAEVDAGADLLLVGDVGVGNTTPAATLVGLLTGKDVTDVIGRGSGIDDAAWVRKAAAIRDAARRGRPHLADPVTLLATVAGADFAALTGFLLQAAVRRTPVVLDGATTGACALVADRIAYRARSWWLAGHRSTEPAHTAALERLSLDPVLDYRLAVGEGAGALLALPILAAAAATLDELPPGATTAD